MGKLYLNVRCALCYLLYAPMQFIQEYVVHNHVQRIRHNSDYHIWYDNVLQIKTNYHRITPMGVFICTILIDEFIFATIKNPVLTQRYG